MDYGFDDATNERVHQVMEEFKLKIAENEYFHHNGYTLRSEMFANHLITSSPDGVGLFVFDEESPWEIWKFTKMLNMVSFPVNPAVLYHSLDEIMASGREQMVTVMSMPFDEEGKMDSNRQEALVYAIHGLDVRPFSEQEIEELKSTLPDIPVTFRQGVEWAYDPNAEYARLVV